ncbi:MAG TPA: hypothetical protein VGM93_05575 [Acidimicrobiales bacterium]
MIWLFGLIGVVIAALIGFVAIGRETSRLSTTARPAVFDLEEAVVFIADELPVAVASRLTHDDVRWILRADVDLLEDATTDDAEQGIQVVDEDRAIARILAEAEEQGRELVDGDVVAVLDARLDYLEAIGAVGGKAEGPDDPLPDGPAADA